MSKSFIIYGIIVIAALIITGVIVVKKVIPAIKRKKLAQGWSDIAKKAGLNLTADYIQGELAKVSNADIDTLITFSQLLQAKNYLSAFGMFSQVDKILNQTKLGNLETYITAFLGGTPKK
jgi:hypothetical protein